MLESDQTIGELQKTDRITIFYANPVGEDPCVVEREALGECEECGTEGPVWTEKTESAFGELSYCEPHLWCLLAQDGLRVEFQ